jgi:hypothetical protein
VPHEQAPLSQLSATSVSHSRQVEPCVPQEVIERAWQLPLSQQPLAQERLSQMQPLVLQCWPVKHIEVPSQAQVPLVAQWLARSGSHEVQAPPPVPQVLSDARWQVAPEQQPKVQVLLQKLHTPPTSHENAPQLSHGPPPVPHAPWLVPNWQVVPLQQPGHELGSQAHTPPEQCWP